MSYTVAIDETGPWLVIEYANVTTGDELVAARAEAASLNADAGVSDFILDFTDVTEFILSSESVDALHAIDRERSRVLSAGRCALVVPREIIEIGATFLAAVSPLNLDYRSFATRSAAEHWLRGELPTPPPTLPRRR
jgi:hypothetical protein